MSSLFLQRYLKNAQLDEEGLLDRAKARFRKGSAKTRIAKAEARFTKNRDKNSAEYNKTGDWAARHRSLIAHDSLKVLDGKKAFGKKDGRKVYNAIGKTKPDHVKKQFGEELDQYIDYLIAEGFTEEEINIFLESIDLETFNKKIVADTSKKMDARSLKLTGKEKISPKEGKVLIHDPEYNRLNARYSRAKYTPDGALKMAKDKAKALGFKTEEFTEAELNHLLAVESSDANEKNMSGDSTKGVKTSDIKRMSKADRKKLGKNNTTHAGD